MKPSKKSTSEVAEDENEHVKHELLAKPVSEGAAAVLVNDSAAEPLSGDPYAALKLAIKAALDLDDLDLAVDLTAALKRSKTVPKTAPVLAIAGRRPAH